MIQCYILGTTHPKRRHIFPVLKPFEKNRTFSDKERLALYGISETDIEFTNSIEEASVAILPMSWNFYKKTKTIDEALEGIALAKRYQKKVLSFVTGDFGVSVPYFDHLIVLRNSGNKSKLPKTHLGMPTFIKDPLVRIFKTNDILVRDYTAMPVIGFCGQANASVFNALSEIVKTMSRNFLYRMRLRSSLPQQVLSTSYTRASLLKNFEKSTLVRTNFIRRKKYRAGASDEQQRKKTTVAFYENMQQSDYVLCMRGAGNFSVRLYETLAMGRIPVFIDTDCLLPSENNIAWKQHVVWVPYSDRKRVAAYVDRFHKGLSPEKFRNLQQQNRSLWENQLTLGGFFKTTLHE